MNRRMGCAAIGASVFVCAGSAMAASPITATFDSDAENFQGSTISTTQIHLGAGGNPGGFIEIRRDLGGPAFDIGTENRMTPEFLGDYVAGGINEAGFDLRVPSTPVADVWLRFRSSVSMNGWYHPYGAPANDNVWHEYSSSFDPSWDDATALGNGWLQEAGAGTFSDTMKSVGWIEVRLITIESTLADIDNVYIVPTPGALALSVVGMGFGLRRRSR
ncbi:MAG: hypothetical protein H6812_07165 [Phycisphaeraceae bacterium]|nr:hypothetical protein [Phycisphaerales bacterium]MCB9843021.1 hypothetical protein [Phycisphaeraceae bacterium]